MTGLPGDLHGPRTVFGMNTSPYGAPTWQTQDSDLAAGHGGLPVIRRVGDWRGDSVSVSSPRPSGP